MLIHLLVQTKVKSHPAFSPDSSIYQSVLTGTFSDGCSQCSDDVLTWHCQSHLPHLTLWHCVAVRFLAHSNVEHTWSIRSVFAHVIITEQGCIRSTCCKALHVSVHDLASMCHLKAGSSLIVLSGHNTCRKRWPSLVSFAIPTFLSGSRI